ncbi:hypothetical protein LSAT2_013778, partial [Lamellibrachia satsuma]
MKSFTTDRCRQLMVLAVVSGFISGSQTVGVTGQSTPGPICNGWEDVTPRREDVTPRREQGERLVCRAGVSSVEQASRL